MNALLIKDLYKVYANVNSSKSNQTLEALKKISLEVKQGDFFALLGPNGAGKSTTIGIITGLINKTSGMVKVFDNDIDLEWEEARKLIGVVPQEFNFSIFETVYNIVLDQAGYYGVSRKIAKERAEKYLKLLGLWEKKDSVSRTLSGGMKRRLMIARALLHEPPLLILDEPTAGVDVELRRGMWDFLIDLNKNGTTIILTTHYLDEAELLCRNIAIINKGLIIEHSATKNLLDKMERHSYIFDLQKNMTHLQLNHKTKLNSKTNFIIKKIDPRTIEVDLLQNQNLNDLFTFFKKEDLEIRSMRNKSNRLEELFLRLVEEKSSVKS
ncbi:ABC transporter ATP-binding protein [Candidatus Woesearchaeota archaeon]|nr:ABC transporter ATP-binding protein [Candidatus Woesearchaeota archaeon]